MRNRLSQLRAFLRKDGGYTTETVAVAALLIALALLVLGILGDAVIDKANSINLDGVQP